MAKVIIFDLGGTYFTHGTAITIERCAPLVSSKAKLADVLEHKEGYAYRVGKLSKREFWAKAKQKLKIDPRTAALWVRNDELECHVNTLLLTDQAN
jgi:hypothetical protein